jgi:ATP-dependent helicase YprA (DUF1998 family)
LVVGEIRQALVDYLATTFSLADDDVRDDLATFLTDPHEGIFRGPYLRVRTPFRAVDQEWRSPLGWLPDWFVPYRHQAEAFERLSTAGGRTGLPTLVTTGTGSGKTECFLMPILDHCARQRDVGSPGIKALILYPMNALASDQAGRLAELIATEPRLAGLSAGLYIGENGTNTAMGPDHLIDDRHALRSSPPDILLTNYKMLDFLLLRREDHDLWAASEPETLRYVVLDEFHTYDGAQGTDVAMLLRRLAATLGLAGPQGPLGSAVPVATSATLTSDQSGVSDLRTFAAKVFGIAFDADSVIGESRQTVDEACDPVDYELPIPSVDDVVELDDGDLDSAAWLFTKRLDDPADVPPTDVVALGKRLLSHPLTRAVLSAVGDRSRSFDETVREAVARAPEWGRVAQHQPERVATALSRYLALLSTARRRLGDRNVPLFAVEVQLWVREVSRLLRTVEPSSSFQWADTPASASLGADEPTVVDGVPALPAVYCRRCGHAGWMGLASELNNTLSDKHAAVYRSAVDRSPHVRVLLRAHPEDPAALLFDPQARQMVEAQRDGVVPVHLTPDAEAARRQTCPACGEADAIRFLGLAVASLASVSINTLFGSANVELEERKLLAFTDSVQDASHRASFFAGRTHRFNLRSLMSGALQATGDDGVSLADLGDVLAANAGSPHERFALVPPDLTRDPLVRTVWADRPEPDALEVLRQRVGFEVDLEFGLRSRVGRTLEQSVAAAAGVDWGRRDETGDLVWEVVRDVLGDPPEAVLDGIDGYLLGLGERLRGSGALFHPLLDPYVREAGRQWFIWGGRPAGLPPFTPGQGRPTFATTSGSGDFDSLTALGTTPTWFVDWATRTLGLEPAAARTVNDRVVRTLAEATEVVRRVTTAGGHQVFGLDRSAVVAVDIGDDSLDAAVVRCDLCGATTTVPPVSAEDWSGVACLRYRCPGHLRSHHPREGDYYRRFYRLGRARRVVTAEHTGLLGRRDREAVEQAFKSGLAPDAPNVLTATPTLEMGIDIGDLSAVMLTSVPRNPASYIQRVGRAGRATGNALITTFVRSDTHGLYYLAEPEAMLAGVVRPPNCYLEATETLERQYVAYLLDRIADRSIDGPALTNRIGDLMKVGFEPDGLFRVLVDTSIGETAQVDRFIALFGEHLGVGAAARLRDFAGGGIEARVKEAADTWFEHRKELDLRRDRLNRSIERLEALANLSEDDEEELRGLKGQRSAVVRLLREHRNEYPLSALERLGLLPNYTLLDDTVTLSANLWWKDGDEYRTETVEYGRPGRIAIREFAPGNTFYQGGHRHFVDALEIGAAQEPLYERWRLCPDCSFADIEAEGTPPMTCPRCGRAGIADTGSRHRVLRLRTALASGSEESARVYDEDDDRVRESYEVITMVDPDPTEISGAWLLDQTFGAELCTRTRLRTFNLGLAERPGENLPIAGEARHVSAFTVCAQCGSVRDVRDDRGGKRKERLHQGWCKVRSGAVAEHWDPLILLHELTTEAIRFVVPVSMYEVDERLASFKAALLLGIRARLGGDPDHLTVTTADSPNISGQGRRRFLVLYDQIPGGTGYLAPLADADQVHEILTAAREVIARCPCRSEGRPACHRCLLGVVDRWEYDLVRRDLARELLDGLLEDWNPSSVATVAGASIAKVEESELERRFKVALREWAEHEPTGAVDFNRVPGKGHHDAFELSIRSGADVVRYRIDEQQGISTSPSTLPDFLIRRMDESGPEIAVYLDGFEYHASADHNHIADDARKRAGVRASGRLVWNLTWNDVQAFHDAVTADPPHRPPARVLLDAKARAVAQQVQLANAGAVEIDAVQQNPMALLLGYLVRPDSGDWRRLALSVVAGIVAREVVVPLDQPGLAAALEEALAGREPQHSDSSPPATVHAGHHVTAEGLRLNAFLEANDPNAERWTVLAVLSDDADDVETSAHRGRWADWLAWSNVLQFLGAPHESSGAVLAAASQATTGDHDDLWLRYLAGTPTAGTPLSVAVVPTDLAEEQKEELELMSHSVRALVEQVLDPNGSPVVAGHETEDGLVVEAAWPDRRVGVLLPGDPVPSGWDARAVDEWTTDDLLTALKGRA